MPDLDLDAVRKEFAAIRKLLDKTLFDGPDDVKAQVPKVKDEKSAGALQDAHDEAAEDLKKAVAALKSANARLDAVVRQVDKDKPKESDPEAQKAQMERWKAQQDLQAAILEFQQAHSAASTTQKANDKRLRDVLENYRG